jgi:hypothetical protein
VFVALTAKEAVPPSGTWLAFAVAEIEIEGGGLTTIVVAVADGGNGG